MNTQAARGRKLFGGLLQQISLVSFFNLNHKYAHAYLIQTYKHKIRKTLIKSPAERSLKVLKMLQVTISSGLYTVSTRYRPKMAGAETIRRLFIRYD